MNDLEERLERIEKKLDALMALLRAGGSNRAAGATPPANGAGNGANAPQVTDADLDGPHGNPEVRFSPKRWNGGDNKGKRFSECEPEFLDMLADAYEWFAARDDEQGATDKNGNPKSRWSRLDAARARGWAARLRGNAGAGAGLSAGYGSGNNNGGAPNFRNSAPANGRKRTSAPEIPAADGSDDEIPF